MVKKYILSLFIIIVTIPGFTQELNCRVQIVSQSIQGTNKRVFDALQTAAFEFMNNRKWTNNVFSNEERIECNILINLTNKSNDEYSGTMQIQSSRPVFNTSYKSPLLNYKDNNFKITFNEQDIIVFNENSFTSNLASILAYYAYIIIGLDYDSFSLEGGTEMFQKAEAIVNNAQNSNAKGWKAFESTKNRYWLVQALLDNTYLPLRHCIYEYHRLGLDVMSSKVEEGRTKIAESFKQLREVHREKPNSFLMQVFFDAKADEIVNIFSESMTDEASRVYSILKEVNNANTSKYRSIISTQ
ncbi:MAG: DUF4835 family protein [Chlorobi bacterium]|nr:DUF4835 family protein [Chlorobiota bacterium]